MTKHLLLTKDPLGKYHSNPSFKYEKTEVQAFENLNGSAKDIQVQRISSDIDKGSKVGALIYLTYYKATILTRDISTIKDF